VRVPEGHVLLLPVLVDVQARAPRVPPLELARPRGKAIAVLVYSNLDRVELVHNGRSLDAKDMAKDGHLAWNVPYAPGVIEARGYRGGQQVMTATREPRDGRG
jgi:hypothetical protein